MDGISHILTIGIGTWLAILAALILYRMLTGRIETSGLFSTTSTKRKRRGIDPERVQLLVIFVAGLAVYVSDGLAQMEEAPIASLPEPPEFLVSLILASNSLYLGGKLARKIKGG